ncbi:topology modulation protein [Paenibacillus montaniterrae]|uniref:Topology modulation protein n=1 Tax=Paenibacillus montaniterrae TaxID=429341 RepID=A0A919YTJ2_9BACL|nr:DNA topology modulation protein [Paenibacillus montaniterrae]GIP18104.1 topology modulation protein [Paenibacillus montaniterrae]
MKRIMIIGSGGAGKSTLAKQLGEALQLPVHHLDAYFWKPGWTPTPDEEWDSVQENLVLEEQWIIDGNYGRTLDIRMNRADVIILLDFPRWITVYRVIKRRIMYHGKTRPDLNEGCPESLDFEFLKWVWTFRKTKIPGILQKLANYNDKHIMILKSPREARKFINEAKALGKISTI